MVIFPGAQWCHRHQMDHVSLKIAKKLSTRFEKQLKAPNILKGLHSKHLFCLLWFISKLLFSAFLLNILTLAVHKSAHVLLNQHLRQTDTQRNGHPEMLQLCQLWHNKFDAEKQQVAAPPRAPNPSWDVTTQPSASWSQRAAEAGGGAAAQPWSKHDRLLVSASPNAGEHPWRLSSSCSPTLLHNRTGKLYNTSYIIWLGRS